MQKEMRQQNPFSSVIPAYSGQIPVCLRCGERDIRPQGIREGLWPGGGEGMAWVCDECGYIGQPLLIDPDDRRPSEKDKAWEKEYEATAEALDEEVDRAPAGMRNLGIVFLVVAAIFFLPPIMLATNAMTSGQFGLLPSVLGQSWIFLGIATVALVLGVRKVEQAGRIEKARASKGPLDRLQEAVERDEKPR